MIKNTEIWQTSTCECNKRAQACGSDETLGYAQDALPREVNLRYPTRNQKTCTEPNESRCVSAHIRESRLAEPN